ncbi:MAG: undecaprenyl-diphosphate phosphatase [Nanoarchaeota archaeon]|nr:undecaprenyl-diphosphate phosphatase [Nanoarchaeota archaeon]
MTLLQSAILGAIQGITEWLPVSSSGHLAIIENWFGLNPDISFNVFLHFATLLVIFIVFWKDIVKVLKAFCTFDFKSEYGKLSLFIIIGSIITAAIGFTFKDLFASFFSNLTVVGIALLVTGILLFFSERRESNKKLGYWDSIWIGLMQGLAIIPGISRSGATISMGLLRGVDKVKVFKFSFLLVIPAILGATLLESSNVVFNLDLLIGFMFSFVFGYISLKLLMKLVINKKFHYFAWYCWGLGLLTIILSL